MDHLGCRAIFTNLMFLQYFSADRCLATALLYAAEAYHTRGAIRHVVGNTQMKILPIESISTEDLWVSMIENWGETNKEYNHCQNDPFEVCFVKMCKYLWRVFDAMKVLRSKIPAPKKPGLVHFWEEGFANPGYAMDEWIKYKRQGKAAISTSSTEIATFLRQFGCTEEAPGKQFSQDCLKKINEKVNAYNVRLATIITADPKKPIWHPYAVI